MTPETLLDLSALPQFPRTAAELVRVAGREAAARLIGAWGGRGFPVPRYTRRQPQAERRFAQLAAVVGEAAALRIVAHWGGLRLDIPNCQEALNARRHDALRAQYDHLTRVKGYSHPEAVWEIGLTHAPITDRTIEKALVQPNSPSAPPAAQGDLF
jgi:hypothetical protein